MIVHGIDLNSHAIHEFCRKWKIKELCIFGSILRDDYRPDSDIDLLADYEQDAEWDLFDHMEMEEDLGQIVGRSVDVLDRIGVETCRNRFLKSEILSSIEPIHASR